LLIHGGESIRQISALGFCLRDDLRVVAQRPLAVGALRGRFGKF
jgi:hypothetical protein